MILDPHQEFAAKWLRCTPRGGLADEMRVGKTAPTIRAAVESGAKLVVVLCPAIAVANWHREIIAWAGALDSPTAWVVESYDRFVRNVALREEIERAAPDTVIFDEAHYLRNPSAKRTKLALGARCDGESKLLAGAVRVWFLTGTPMPNHVGELWPILRTCNVTDLSAWQWQGRYLLTRETTYGTQVIGNRRDTFPEVRAMFRSVFLRRTYAEVFGGESPLVWEVTSLDPGKLPDDIHAVLTDPTARKIAERYAAGETGAEIEGHLSRLRRATSLVKGTLATAYLRDRLDEDPSSSYLVLGWHTDALKYVADAFGDRAALITGATSRSVRAAIQDRFQAGTLPLVFGNIQACGTAISLSRAKRVIFLERTWTPGDNVQAAMRAVHRDRPGPVPVDILALAGSIDDAVARVDARKYRDIAAIIDGKD